MWLSLDDKCESEEISAAKIDSYLNKERSIPADDSEVLIEMVEIKNGEEENSQSYAFKVFVEMPNRKVDMKVEDSVQNDSVKLETQVCDKMFQTVSAVRCYYGDIVMLDNPLALAYMLSACGHDQLIGRGTFDYLSELKHAKLILFLHRFPLDQFGLHFPFDPGSSFLIAYLGATWNYVSCEALCNLTLDQFTKPPSWNSYIAPLKLQLRNSMCASN